MNFRIIPKYYELGNKYILSSITFLEWFDGFDVLYFDKHLIHFNTISMQHFGFPSFLNGLQFSLTKSRQKCSKNISSSIAMRMTCQYPLIHNNPLLHHLRAYLVHLKFLSTVWFILKQFLLCIILIYNLKQIMEIFRQICLLMIISKLIPEHGLYIRNK